MSETKDWVVICERDSRRDVLVFAEPITMESQPALQVNIDWDPNDPGCEGWIVIADSQWVRLAIGKQRPDGNRERLEAAERASLHDGIVDSVCEGEDATIRYWTGRRWISLPAYWDEPGMTRGSSLANVRFSLTRLDAHAHQR
jgi:hypothetical protein